MITAKQHKADIENFLNQFVPLKGLSEESLLNLMKEKKSLGAIRQLAYGYIQSSSAECQG